MKQLPEKNCCQALEYPRISVLMVAYNSAPYVSDAIKSILKQTFQAFEFIIVNDGSTDDTTELIREFARQDPRIRVIETENRGIGTATNRGLLECHGKYVAIMDSDDISEPVRLEAQADFLDSHPDIAGVGSQWLMIDTKGQIVGLDTHPANPELVEVLMFAFFCLHHPTIMVRRDALIMVGGYTEDRACLVPDYDLFLRLTLAGFTLSNLPQVLFRWRLNPTGTTRSKAKAQTLSADLVRRNAFQLMQQKDPRWAAMIATTVVKAFPAGTCFDEKIRKVLPDHPPSPLLQHWRALSGNDTAGNLEFNAVEWLNNESANVSQLADNLLQNNFPWLSELVKKRAAKHSSTVAYSWDLSGGKSGEKGLLSVLVPIGTSQEELLERLLNIFDALSGKVEVLIFADYGQKLVVELPPAPAGVHIRFLHLQESSHQCSWQQALAASNGRCLAYLEEGCRFNPNFIGEGLSVLNQNEQIKAVFAPAKKFFLEAFYKGKPIFDPAPSPKWSKTTLIGHRQIYLSGFIHDRSLLQNVGVPLNEVGEQAPLALAMELAVRRAFVVLQDHNSQFIPEITLENSVLQTIRSRLVEWYFDFGLGVLPAKEYWKNLADDQLIQIEKQLSSRWLSGELIVCRQNQQIIENFFKKYVRNAVRSPLYQYLICRQKWKFVQDLYNTGQSLMAFQASIIIIRDYMERAINKLRRSMHIYSAKKIITSE